MKKNYRYIALAQRVIAVAVINMNRLDVFDWAAYIDAVPGDDHHNEFQSVATHGAKLSKSIAGFMFPDLDIGNYRL